MLIYLITNKVNGKVYVGKTTKTLAHRWKEHKTAAKNGGHTIIQAAIRKYGDENFEIRELVQAKTLEELSTLEKTHIQLYRATDSTVGYNMTPGGDGGTCKGFRVLDVKQRKRLSRISKKLWADPEYRHNVIQGRLGRIPWNKGKCASEEAKQNQSLGQLGKKLPYSQRLKIGNFGKARWQRMLPEQREAFRKTMNRVSLEREAKKRQLQK
jgi:group I intron endonuclease